MLRPLPSLRLLCWSSALLTAGSALAAVGSAPTALVSNSPFAPSGTASLSVAAPAQDFELTGATSEGAAVTVCIYERQTKRSQWIPVGGVSDGIRIISYDGEHDQAVVMVGGARKSIAMRKATYNSKGGAGGPAPAPNLLAAVAPPPAPGPGSPVTAASKPEQEQREARMLVSDLLEIGVQQRKANQEARLKAAAGTAATPSN